MHPLDKPQSNIIFHGLAKDHMEMIDYITSITLKPKISKFLIKKEAKAVYNELLIHAAHPMMDL